MNVNAGHGRKHVSMWHIFLEMILAARSSLDDQEYGIVYESAESVYPRGIFLEMILAAISSLDDQEYGNVYESAESVYPCVAYSLK